ncbi:L,D-transpeptidase [Streptomyces sp. NPDC054933]
MAGVVRLRAWAALLTAVTVLPLLLGGGTAVAGGRSGDPRVPLYRLVPGVPLPRGAAVTPDESYAPKITYGRNPARMRRMRVPTTAQARAARLTEYVPVDDARAVRAKGARRYCSRHSGPYQRQIARFLHLLVRNRQSHASCTAIRGYQRAHGIRPAIGFAGPVTWGMMRDSVRTRAAARKALIKSSNRWNCPAGPYRIACVDQDYQEMWVQNGNEIIFGPVPIRTGLPGYATRNGMHRVYWRNRDHVSTIYHTPMPFAQFFSGGQALHGIIGNVYGPDGSYGCVNLRMRDAQELWDVLQQGDRVYVWGVRQMENNDD